MAKVTRYPYAGPKEMARHSRSTAHGISLGVMRYRDGMLPGTTMVKRGVRAWWGRRRSRKGNRL